MNHRLSTTAAGLLLLACGALRAQNDFTDRFERPDGPVDGWTAYRGTWNIQGGELRHPAGDGWLWAGDPPIVLDGDFDLSIRVEFPSIPGDEVGRHGGIMFFAGNATDRTSTTGYTVDWIDRAADHGFRLIRWDPTAVELVLGTPQVSQPPQLWEVSVEGDRIIVRGDGATVIDVVDTTYRQGHFGLWSYTNSAMVFDDVDISSGPPGLRACFEATPRSGEVPLDVSFDASCSQAGEGATISSYAWTFGDGATGSGSVASHRFATAKTYTVTLRVTNTLGETASTTRTIDAFDPGLPPPIDVDRLLSEQVRRNGAEADSTVVFNEVMYHPPGNEDALEWLELYNQMAVAVDLSSWTVQGGVLYELPAGTVIPGGGFLVIARDPPAFQSATGFEGAFGPFQGRLENGGEDLQLFSRAGRQMDGLRYNDGGQWPVAPDGSGVTLAKLDPLSASGPAQNWAQSAELGGTPGAPNFPSSGAPPPASTVVFNEVRVVALSDYSVEILNRGGTSVQLQGYAIGNGDPEVYRFPSRTLGAGAYLALTRADLGFDLKPDGKLFLFSPDLESVLDAAKLSVGIRARHPDGTGPWLVPSAPTLGAPNSFDLEDSIVINEIHYHPRLEPAKPDVYSETQLFALDATWRYDQSGQNLGSSWRGTSFDDGAWPSGAGLFYRETGPLPGPKTTPLDLGPVTYYFRKSFDLQGAVEGGLALRLVVDDGAVVYLNGVEALRFNMPEGAITSSTVASTGVGDAVITGPYELPAGSLRVGTNVIAVELHQQSAASSDVVFGAELVARVLVEAGHPVRQPPESWIELFNRGTQSVDLTGWRIDRGIEYAFAPGTRLGPDEYLVVAEDQAVLRARYPAIRIVGNFTGVLSDRSDLIELEDALGNPVDAVRYFDGGRWPEWADGGGSSLELRDPHADNSKGEAWAASDESWRTDWKTYSYRMVAAANVGPTQWNEFVVGLLAAGEMLVDDLSVVQAPSGARTQILQNGSFQTGSAAWRFLGNHRHTAVIDDPEAPGSKVLHVVASGPTEHMHNHLETTLVNNTPAPNGVEYEVSFRARWLAGSNQLNTRLYFDRVQHTTLIDVPEGGGTPGARNSTYEANIGPTFDRLRHAPVVPDAGQTVGVTVLVEDPDGVDRVTLWYSVAGGAWLSASMSLEAGTTTLYSGRIPGQTASRLVQLYVEAEDSLGAVSTFPAAGRDSRALYKVKDGQSRDGPIHNFRILMTTADATFMHSDTNVMSNERLGATVIYREEEVFYDAGCRLKGSQRGRMGGSRVSFSVEFQPDELFRGAHRSVSLDRSGGWGIGAGPTGQDEIVIKHAINQAGLPGMYDDIAWLVAPRSSENGPCLLMMSKYSSVFTNTQYPNDNDGTMYKVELIYYPTTTSNGSPEGLKMPQPDVVVGTDLRDLGDDKEAYRWTFLLENNEDRDDYSGFMRLCKAMSSSGTAFKQGMEELLDIDTATRTYAIETLCGISDTYWFAENYHNVMYYELRNAGRFVPLSWDNDVAFTRSTSAALWGGPNLAKLYAFPEYERLFYGHIHDVTSEFFNASYMRNWTDHYGLLAQETSSFNTVLNYINARATYARNSLPARVPFAITTNGGSDFVTDESTATLEGTGWFDVRTIIVPGLVESPAVTWPARDRWRLTVPLAFGANALDILAFDYSGNLLDADSIVVTSTSGPEPGEFVRGDSNRDLRVDISDAVTSLLHLFASLDLDCLDAADANDDESLNLTDPIYTLDYLFRSGPQPPAPFPSLGLDATGNGALGCP